jgi:transcriptional regulator with XRE-family HTH domain
MTAQELKAYRERLGITQAELSERLGLNREKTVSEFELGIKPVPDWIEKKLAPITKEELKEFIKKFQAIPSQVDIEKRAGVPTTIISQIVARGRELTPDQARKLKDEILKIQAELKKI